MIKRTLLILMSTALLLAACGGAKATTAALAPREAPSFAEGQALPAQPQALDQRAGSTGNVYQSPAPQPDRLVIKNANLTIAVSDPGQSMDRISRMADEMGGFVVSANIYQTELSSGAKVPRASITIRVPATRLNEALEKIKAETAQPVISETISSQDVTSEYTDLQSRLRNLEAAEAQLQNIMDQATKTQDVLNVYQQLVQVREQIEVIKGQIKFYEQSAALSAIAVELMANEAVQPLTIGGWQPGGVARQALQGLINTLKFLVNVGIYLVLLVIPVLVVILLPPGLILWGILRWRARRRARSKPVEA